MKKLVLGFALVTSVAASQAVSAITISGSIGGAPTGANYINFDNVTGSGTLNSTVSLEINPDAGVVTGTTATYAAPYLSDNNGNNFGNPNVPGADTTPYLTTGKYSNGGSITLTFASSQMYFGLLWGSIDSYNNLQFFSGNTLIDTVTGSDVLASANGDQGVNGTLYVNINTDSAFNRVVATSGDYAFEFDNIAYNGTPLSTSVPDGGLTVALLGMAFAGVAGLRRKLNQQ